MYRRPVLLKILCIPLELCLDVRSTGVHLVCLAKLCNRLISNMKKKKLKLKILMYVSNIAKIVKYIHIFTNFIPAYINTYRSCRVLWTFRASIFYDMRFLNIFYSNRKSIGTRCLNAGKMSCPNSNESDLCKTNNIILYTRS